MSTKRILALIIVALLSFSLLVACTKTTEEPKQQEEEKKEETAQVDYGGEKFYAFDLMFPKAWRDYTEEEKEEAGSAPVYSAQKEAMANNVLRTESKYNCQVIFDSAPSGDASELIAFFTGGTEMDIIYQTSGNLRDLYLGEALADIKDLEAVDLTDTEKWGSAYNLEMVQYQGHQFGIPYTGSLYMPCITTSFYGAFLQSNVAMAQYELDWTVKELVEAGDWTWENFLEIMPTVSVETTDEKESKHAVSYLDGAWPYLACLYVNEASFVEYNEETGKYEYGLLSDAAVEALEFCREMIQTEGFDSEGMQWAEIERINDGDYTFFLTSTNRAFAQIAELTSEVSWVPFPYGPHSIYGVSTSAFNNESRDCVIGVFVGGLYDSDPDEETQRNGVIFNDIFEPTEEYGKDGYDEWMMHNLFTDDDGMSMKYFTQYTERIANSWSDVIGLSTKNAIVNKIQAVVYAPTKDIRDTLGAFEEPINNILDLEFDQ